MNSELIMKSDLLDILFEKRNKQYGAYNLRKFYGNRLIKSLVLMTGTVVLFSAFTFIPDEKETPIVYEVMDPGMGRVAPPEIKPQPKPKLPKSVKIDPVSTVKLTNKIVIVNKPEEAEELHNLEDNTAIGSTTNILEGRGGGEIIGAGQGGNGNDVAPVTPSEPEVDINTPLNVAEEMPQYPGGLEALRKFLMRNLTNPRDLEPDELISVKIRMVVGYDGKLKSFELAEDGGKEFNNEVIRVLKKMPAWIPGKSKGKNVSVYYTIPVKFVGQG